MLKNSLNMASSSSGDQSFNSFDENPEFKRTKVKIVQYCLNNLKPKLPLKTQVKLRYQSFKNSCPEKFKSDYELSDEEIELINDLFLKQVDELEKTFSLAGLTDSGFPGVIHKAEDEGEDAVTLSVHVVPFMHSKLQELREVHKSNQSALASLQQLSDDLTNLEDSEMSVLLSVPSGEEVAFPLVKKKIEEELELTEQKIKEREEALSEYDAIANFDQYLADYKRINEEIEETEKLIELLIKEKGLDGQN